MRHYSIMAAVLASCAYAGTALAQASGSTSVDATTPSTPSTKVGGVMWLDFGYIKLQNQNANGVYTDTPPTGTGFDVKRFYLVVDGRYNDMWAANLTLDAQYSSDVGQTTVFVKKMYVEGRFDPRFVLRIGAADLPWIPFVEGQQGYRWIDKVSLDRLGLGTTADWGLNALGTFGPDLSYSCSVVNGGGYKDPARTKKVDFEGRINSSPLSWLTLAAGFYSGHLGQIDASNSSFPSNTATRWNALAVAYVAGVRVGIEYFNARNYKTVNDDGLYGTSSIVTSSGAPPASDRAEGVAPFASYRFDERWSVFGRYDNVKLSKDVAPNLKDEYFNVGIAYEPLQPLDVALVYKHETVSNGSVKVSGFDAGGSVILGGATGAYSGRYEEIGLYLQFRY